MIKRLFAALLLLALPCTAHAQAGRLTVERVFSPEFFGDFFGSFKWKTAGTYTIVEGGQQGQPVIAAFDAKTGARTVLVTTDKLTPDGAAKPLAIHNYSWSPGGRQLLIYTNSAKVWRFNTRGDYWVLDLDTWRLSKLGRDAKPSTLMFAKFSPDSKRVAYVRENNLYVEDIATGMITPLTTDGSVTTINGTFDWVYEEELHIADGFRWSPDGKSIAYWQLDASGVGNFLLINNTDSIYSFVKPVQYPKVGTTNSAARIGIVSSMGGTTTWVDLHADPRNNYPARMDFTPAGDVMIQLINREQNSNRVLLASAQAPSAREILHETESAWLDPIDEVIWLDAGRNFTWVSERDGWRHVYSVSADGKSVRLLTPGNYDVWSILKIDTAGKWIYFIASPENPTQRYLYRTRLDRPGAPQRLTPAEFNGNNTYNISPDASTAFHTHSAFGVPNTQTIIELPSHKVARVAVANQRVKQAVASLERGPHRFVKVRTRDGVLLDAWLMLPPGFDSTKAYPIVFFTYGETAQSTVRDQWEFSDYLWHLMLTQKGYIVASIDNRGAPVPRGREFRKAIYKQMGIINTNDQADGARELLGRYSFIDKSRVGVWGWSGGGTMTLNLLFRYPDLYQAGMSVSPQTDYRFYDTIYQERYLGLPQNNKDVYDRAAPINFVQGLRGKLLLVHGGGDDNVHFQNSEALINALVAANKPFQFMEYPNRTHCICEGEGTTEHLYNLLTRFLEMNL